MNENNENLALLYSAYHKFYSALVSLERFNINNDLFDNISNLDTFFSEYRNITFVLQKSLSKTNLKTNYEEIRNKYLSGNISQWMVKTRNEVLKEQPYELKKKIVVTVYSQDTSSVILSKEFILTNEESYSVMNHKIKEQILKSLHLETHFSIEYFFYKESSQELFSDISKSIKNMFCFLQEMEKLLKEESHTVNKIKKKIENLNFYKIPSEVFFTQDYVYYSDLNQFELSQRQYISYKTNARVPISVMNERFPHASDNLDNLFFSFLMLHLFVYQQPSQSVMPTFMVIDNNDKFIMYSFSGSIRTTLYREINELVKLISNEKVKAVFFTCEEYAYPIEKQELYSISYPQRINHAENELASFYMVTEKSGIINCSFDKTKILDDEYIAKKIVKLRNKSTISVTSCFLTPILKEMKNN